MTDRPPWERQDGEPARAYDLFRRYRDLPPRERSLSRLISDLGATKGRRRGDVERLSARHAWVRRAQAWDDELDRRRRDEQVDEVVQMARRHAEIARAVMTTIAQPAILLMQRIREDPNRLLDLSERELLSLTVAAGRVMPGVAQMERQARGERPPAPWSTPPPAPQEHATSEEYLMELFAAMAEIGWVPKPPPEWPELEPREPEE